MTYNYGHITKFANQKILDNLQFTKGLKYFLSGFYKSQKEIKDFIKKCKKFPIFQNSKSWYFIILLKQKIYLKKICNMYILGFLQLKNIRYSAFF